MHRRKSPLNKHLFNSAAAHIVITIWLDTSFPEADSLLIFFFFQVNLFTKNFESFLATIQHPSMWRNKTCLP